MTRGLRGCGNVFEVDTLAVIDESFLNHEILIIRVYICIYSCCLFFCFDHMNCNGEINY